MKILITGCNGQLGWELQQTAPSNIEIKYCDRQSLDITKPKTVYDEFIKFVPDIVINAAAYTAVDTAESDKENCYLVNETGSKNIAEACNTLKAKLIQVSTDFVFDGTKTTPYQTDDKTNPLGVYGASKLAGDNQVSKILGNNAIIIRTAWVYSTHGNNFVKTMLKLMFKREQLGIVYDQVGTPTWAKGLAIMIWSLVSSHSKIETRGVSNLTDSDPSKATILHWTDAGVTSWYDFSIAIEELAIEKGMLDKSITIKPIPTSAYPTPAKRPCFSVIDKTTAEQASGIDTVHWRKQLSAMLDELKSYS